MAICEYSETAYYLGKRTIVYVYAISLHLCIICIICAISILYYVPTATYDKTVQ